MAVKKSVCSKLIKEFQLRELFNLLGWNNINKTEQVAVDAQVFKLEAIAEKSAFFVFVCESPGKVVDYATRKKIDTKITKLYNQHLIIFTDAGKKQQVWQLVVKGLDKPAVVRETQYHVHQEPELLFQKLQHLFFSIDDEENLTIVDVKDKVLGGFNNNAEKVTKKFYEGFKREHTAFLAFIKGIKERADQEWYASLMLNRLMFIYFIQKKGFLNSDEDYLRTKLKESQTKKGKDKFYSFYRNFLLVLFHEGLGSPDHQKLEKELGKIPYLNGGLFDVHELEKAYKDIKVEDQAFERIFAFFDQYEWHLDTRQQATGKEINPDVIGYIFEKYINDRSAMGAYYTKEDITDYIAKNCIIPFLFDEVKRTHPAALKPGSAIWLHLQANPDDYIHEAVQKGVGLELPPEIAKGLTNVKERGEWNKLADEEYRLPTEIWREVVERRRRYQEVKGKIEAGEISAINDLITYNLDITRFAIDIIQNSADPELIRHFYKTLEKLTVLDPTCGSGAFLFAALNILEPLYEACIARMRAFVDEASKGKFKTFEDVIARVDAPEHPNLQYFIFKSIILSNLYGVDIMKEAVEIAKLRLFLKLVACVDVELKKPNMGLEPLPDIDFNIRSGNTLVGFASGNDLETALQTSIEGIIAKPEIEEKMEVVKMAFRRYKEIQLEHGDDFSSYKKAKDDLHNRLQQLNATLNEFLSKEYGKSPSKAKEYKEWLDSHKPFHWLAEFYEIIHDRGGFDVIIGNPPYLEYSKVKDYKVLGFKTASSSNLYTFTVERSFSLASAKGQLGMIIPISIACSGAMEPLREFFTQSFRSFWLSHFSNRPGQMFTGAQNRLTIFLTSGNQKEPKQFSTRYHRWDAKNGERANIFHTLSYQLLSKENSIFHGLLPKIGCQEASGVLNKINTNKTVKYFTSKLGKHKLYWVRVPGYFCQFTIEPPMARPEEGGPDRIRGEVNYISFPNSLDRNVVSCVLNSSTYYQFFCIYTDTRHINPSDVAEFPFDLTQFNKATISKLNELAAELADSYSENTNQWRKSGLLIDSIDSKPCKYIVDEIDSVLAKHYGFTDEELDFIINYDIKYRMGKGAGEEDGDE